MNINKSTSFDDWNNSDVNIMIYNMYGLSGKETRLINLDICEKFIQYLHTKPKNEIMYHVYIIENIYNYTIMFDPDYELIKNEYTYPFKIIMMINEQITSYCIIIVILILFLLNS